MTSLQDTYRRYTHNLEKINLQAQHCTETFISSVEASFQEDINNIFKNIVSSENPCRIIMLTGPSSSGKTTTAKILEAMLNNYGKATHTISLDNFYIGKNNVPKLANGEYDFESIKALDIPFIKSCIKSIIQNGSCVLPKYNFLKGERENSFTELKIEKSGIIIIEGIHALNPIFTEGIENSGIKKIYISVKQGIKDNDRKLLRAEDIRFLRRLVRDISFRGSNAEETILMWDNVCRGERKYIRPFKYMSDFTINTFHPYEVNVIKDEAIKILSNIDESFDGYEYASSMVSILERFVSIDKDIVPNDSLLREFIGGGVYKY